MQGERDQHAIGSGALQGRQHGTGLPWTRPSSDRPGHHAEDQWNEQVHHDLRVTPRGMRTRGGTRRTVPGCDDAKYRVTTTR
jgi:hypothetical protein